MVIKKIAMGLSVARTRSPRLYAVSTPLRGLLSPLCPTFWGDHPFLPLCPTLLHDAGVLHAVRSCGRAVSGGDQQ